MRLMLIKGRPDRNMDVVMIKSFFSVKNLSIKGSEPQSIVSDLSFTIEKGQTLALVGESGSGKSMTALAMMQLLPQSVRVAQNSQILLQGEDLLTLSEAKLQSVRGRRVAMVFQEAMTAFNPVLTIGQQIREVLNWHFSLKGKVAAKKIVTLLHQVGIDDAKRCMASYPHQLSGGQRQRAMIAMALAGEPELLIADEPTTALDVTLQQQILTLLKKLQKTYKLSILFITHNLALLPEFADDVLVLQSGKMVEYNTVKGFFNYPKRAYSKTLLVAAKAGQKPQQNKPENTETILSVEQLKVYFSPPRSLFWAKSRPVKAVDGVSFALSKGQTLALVGESGSGKSTVAQAIVDLVPTKSGQVLLLDQALSAQSYRKKRKLLANVQMIFQDSYAALNPRMQVGDIIAEGLVAMGMSGQLQRKAVNRVLAEVNLPRSCSSKYPHEFSGGQRQRICIARALVMQPKLLICDEPTSALDVNSQQKLIDLLLSLQVKHGISYLMITHDFKVVNRMAHQVVIMKSGKIVESATVKQLFKSPQQPYSKQLIAAVK